MAAAKQPKGEIEQAQKPLLEAYANAWQNVVDLQRAIAGNPAEWRRANRLAEARRSIEAQMDDLDAGASKWFRQEFPKVHAMGVRDAAQRLGRTEAQVFSQIDTGAVKLLADDGFGDLLKATRGVRRSVKAMIRDVVRDEALDKAIRGDTAVAAARRAARVIEAAGVHAVKYSDGSLHGLREYANMAVRTKTATAYNLGTLQADGSQGVKFWQVFDGICGWAFHDDTAANGRIVTQDEALAYPISHPNCRRAFGGRPDLTSTRTEADQSIAGMSDEEKRLARNEASRRSKAKARAAKEGRSVAQPEPDPLPVVRDRAEKLPPREAPPADSPALDSAQRAAERRVDRTPSTEVDPTRGGWPPPTKLQKGQDPFAEGLPPAAVRAPDAAAPGKLERGLARLEGGDELAGANPLYSESQEYRLNCTNAVTAYELRRRGYDVAAEAMEVKQGGSTVQQFQGDWGANPSGAGAFQATYPSMRKDILETWPDGGRGYVMVNFNTRLRRGGHAFSVERHGDRLWFVDPQSGRALGDASEYFSGASPKITYGRLDDLPAPDRLSAHVRSATSKAEEAADDVPPPRRLPQRKFDPPRLDGKSEEEFWDLVVRRFDPSLPEEEMVRLRNEVNFGDTDLQGHRRAQLQTEAKKYWAAQEVRYANTVRTQAQFERAVAAGLDDAREALAGGSTNAVSIARLKDGTKVVVRKGSKDSLDAEELATRFANDFGVPVPPTVRQGKFSVAEFVDGSDTALQRFVSGADDRAAAGVTNFEEARLEFISKYAGTPEGRRMGIMDMLIGNRDRHESNWVVREGGDFWGIDHARKMATDLVEVKDGKWVKAYKSVTSSFWDLAVEAGLSVDEVAEATRVLKGMRGEFERLGQLAAYESCLSRAEAMMKVARGELSLR